MAYDFYASCLYLLVLSQGSNSLFFRRLGLGNTISRARQHAGASSRPLLGQHPARLCAGVSPPASTASVLYPQPLQPAEEGALIRLVVLD